VFGEPVSSESKLLHKPIVHPIRAVNEVRRPGFQDRRPRIFVAKVDHNSIDVTASGKHFTPFGQAHNGPPLKALAELIGIDSDDYFIKATPCRGE
jgi:hypothetical protein